MHSSNFKRLPTLMPQRAWHQTRAGKTGITLALSLVAAAVCAQSAPPALPSVTVPGAEQGASGTDFLAALLRFAIGLILWAMCAIAGVIAMKGILKTWNGAKDNDQNKWAAVIGDSLGNVVMVIGAIGVAIWVATFVAAPGAAP